jgi:uncharacterized protein (DUF1015 family)
MTWMENGEVTISCRILVGNLNNRFHVGNLAVNGRKIVGLVCIGRVSG